MLALLAVLIGAAATLGLAEAIVGNWLRSGRTFPVGRREVVQLPVGRTLVYYESLAAVPRDGESGATLKVADGDDEPLRVKALRAFSEDDSTGDDALDYRLWLSGWSGRALWAIDAPAAGRYSIVCHNHSVLSDDQLPADDRIAILREPDSFARVRLVRIIALITGGTMTITLVVIFYLLHMLALDRRHRAAAGAHGPTGAMPWQHTGRDITPT